MPNLAILHTSTRLVRRLTTDASPALASDESAVDTGATRLDISGGPWTLAASAPWTLAAASQAAQDAAGYDPARVLAQLRADFQAYLTLCDGVTNASTNAQILTALHAWMPSHKIAMQRVARFLAG